MTTKIVRKSLYLLYRLHTNQLNSSSNNTFVWLQKFVAMEMKCIEFDKKKLHLHLICIWYMHDVGWWVQLINWYKA